MAAPPVTDDKPAPPAVGVCAVVVYPAPDVLEKDDCFLGFDNLLRSLFYVDVGIACYVVLNLMFLPDGLFKMRLLTRKLLASLVGSAPTSFGCSLPVMGRDEARVVIG